MNHLKTAASNFKSLLHTFKKAWSLACGISMLLLPFVGMPQQVYATTTVSVEQPELITTTSAILSGRLVTDRDTTLLHFEYGTSNNNLTSSTFKNLHSTNNGSIYDKITGLDDGTTYYYRLCATLEGNSESCSSTYAFTTLSQSDFTDNLTITQGTSLDSSYDSAVVSAIFDGAIPGQTYAQFEYNIKGDSLVYASPSIILDTEHGQYSKNLHHLVPETEYEFRLCLDGLCGSKGEFITVPAPDPNLVSEQGDVLYSITTQDADNIGSTVATVNGSVQATPGVSYYFGYERASESSASGSLSLQTTSASLASGAVTNVSGSLTGLLPNTSYRYQLCTALGCGDIKIFSTTTEPDPFVVTTLAVPSGNITESAATISGTYTGAESGDTATFEYGIVESSLTQNTTDVSISTSSGSVQANISNLVADTEYFYRLCVDGTCGSTLSFTTLTETIDPSDGSGTSTGDGSGSGDDSGSGDGSGDNSNTSTIAFPSNGTSATTTTSSASLSGEFTGAVAGTDKAFFKYGTSSALGSETSRDTVSTADGTHTADLLNLSSGQTYFYQICLETDTNEEICGPILAFLTQTASSNTAPSIVLIGNGTMFIDQFSTFTDPGAIANDIEDGLNITVTNITGSVNTAQTGTYTLTYRYIDNDGLTAPERTRTVVVQQSTTNSTNTDTSNNNNSDDTEDIEIDTKSATDIEEDSARLRGEIADMGSADEIDVYFVYGTDEDDLDERQNISGTEDDDVEFSARIDDLDPDTEYFFKACGEDDDDDDNDDCGSTRSFTTDAEETTTSTTTNTEPEVIYVNSGGASTTTTSTPATTSTSSSTPEAEETSESTTPSTTSVSTDPEPDPFAGIQSDSERTRSENSEEINTSSSSETVTSTGNDIIRDDSADVASSNLEPSLLGASAQDAVPVSNDTKAETCTTCVIVWSVLSVLTGLVTVRKWMELRAKRKQALLNEELDEQEESIFESPEEEQDIDEEAIESPWLKTFSIFTSLSLVGLSLEFLIAACVCYVGAPVAVIAGIVITYRRHGMFWKKDRGEDHDLDEEEVEENQEYQQPLVSDMRSF